jgi:cytochrome c551/c552
VVDSLREGFIHNIQPVGVRSYSEELPLLHPSAYYTLNSIPAGEKASFPLAAAKPKATKKETVKDPGAAVNTPDNQMKEARPSTAGEAKKAAAPAATAKPAPKTTAAVISNSEAQSLLTKYTCSACHKPYERSVGPAYSEVAKRKYTVAQIVSLVYNPKPEHWPDYTPMAPMLHVPKKDVEKIAAWINTLKK